MRLSLAALGFSLICFGCQRGAAPPEAAQAGTETPAASENELVVGEPIRHGNLMIFPVSSRAAKTADRFITLDEGLKSGKVVVMEQGSALARQLAAANAAAP